MNYQNIYNQLIEKRKANIPTDCYTERHHIIPVCMGGTNNKDNIVILTAREHFVAHALLVKIHRNNKKYYYKLLNAITAMQQFWGKVSEHGNLRQLNKNSRLYAIWKNELAEWRKNNPELVSSTKGCKLVYNNTTHKTKYVKQDELESFLKNNIDWSITRDNTWPVYMPTKDTIHIYNTETNQGCFISKYEDIPEGWLKGHPTNSATRVQQYNPSAGKVWITNIITNESILHPKTENIPEGWVKGRVIQKLRKDPTNTSFIPREYTTKSPTEKPRKLTHDEKMAAYYERERIRKEKRRAIQYEKYLQIMKVYFDNGWKKFLDIYPEYDKSRNNLCNQFRKYCPEEYEQYKQNRK